MSRSIREPYHFFCCGSLPRYGKHLTSKRLRIWTRGNLILKSRDEEWLSFEDLRDSIDPTDIRNLIRWAIEDTDLPQPEFVRIVQWINRSGDQSTVDASADRFYRWLQSEEGDGYRAQFRMLDRQRKRLLVEIGRKFLPYRVTERHLL
jgi:hypothetical protein